MAAKVEASQNEPENTSNLREMLQSFPAISNIRFGAHSTGAWFASFDIDIDHPKALTVIQHLAYELNEAGANNFSGAFYPKSPPADLNPDPKEYLFWMIDCWDGDVTPDEISKMLSLAAFSIKSDTL